MSKLENISNLYPHNKKVFLKVLENLKTHNKVGVVQATGTGKGKLASCFVEYLLSIKKDAKILIAAPLRSVLQNYRDNFNIKSENIKFATYSKINNLGEIDLLKVGQTYDLIVLDEYHRCGAPEWFKSIQTLFNGVDKGVCKVIGLTATPIRYLDNSRDMSEELFNGNVIQGLNLEEAILDGILPGFVYNACYFGTEKVLKEVEDKLKNNDYKISDDTIRNDLMVKVKELNMIYQNRYKIENIIKDNTKELGRNQKWVIFCRDKQSLGEIREFCVNWFNYKPNLYIINSDRQAEDNDRTLVEFRNVKQGVNVLLCVDMLNEGVHIKDLNGVIMLRKTDSPIIFLQQLGRSLEAGKDFKPIIFDLIGNYKGLKVKQDEIERTPISIVKGIEQKTKGRENYVIVHNFTEELDAVLDELSKYIYTNVWTPEEDKILIDNYSSKGIKYCCNLLQHRTSNSIRYRANLLGLYVEGDWTPEEDEFLIQNYKLKGGKFCEDNLLNRSIESIRYRASRLGLRVKSSDWSSEEINFLIQNYNERGLDYCVANLPNRGYRSIVSKASKLGLSSNSWSEEEDKILIENYSKLGVKYCQNKLSNRSLNAIRSRVKTLNLNLDNCGKSWSKEEEEFLINNYPKYGLKYCEEHLPNRDKNGIRSKIQKLHLVRIEHNQGWTEEEDNILRKYYYKYGPKYCVDKLKNRTLSAIRARAEKLNINGMNREWSKEEIQFLLDNYEIKGPKFCSMHLKKRKYETIVAKANSLGLKRRKN